MTATRSDNERIRALRAAQIDGAGPPAALRSRLSDFYDGLVADLAGGKTAVVELTVPDSVRIRVSDADLETVLGNGKLPAGLTSAQDEVKSTADAWREAEEATDKAQRAADDLWLEQPVATQEHTHAATDLDTSTKAIGALDTNDRAAVERARTWALGMSWVDVADQFVKLFDQLNAPEDER